MMIHNLHAILLQIYMYLFTGFQYVNSAYMFLYMLIVFVCDCQCA